MLILYKKIIGILLLIIGILLLIGFIYALVTGTVYNFSVLKGAGFILIIAFLLILYGYKKYSAK